MAYLRIALLVVTTILIAGAVNEKKQTADPWPCVRAQIASLPPHCLDPKPHTEQFPRWFQEQLLPPKEFDHDYDGELEVRHMIPEDVRRTCASGVRPGGGPALACTRAFLYNPKACTIYMMTEQEYAKLGWDYTIILRHEIGHCLGWHHD